MAEASNTTGATAAFTVYTPLALSDSEKGYIRRVIQAQFIGMPVAVIDRTAPAAPFKPRFIANGDDSIHFCDHTREECATRRGTEDCNMEKGKRRGVRR